MSLSTPYKIRFPTTSIFNAAAVASSAAQADYVLLVSSQIDDLSTMTDPVASASASRSIIESFNRARATLATATPAARTSAVVVSTAAKDISNATSTVLADPERLGMGSADLAIDVGITVFWLMFGLVWLKIANMRRDGKLQWHILLEWMERVVQERLKMAFENGRAVVRPGWKIGAVCTKFGLPLGIVWVGYRVVRFFAKEWWERENSIDYHLAIGLHLLSCLLIAVGPVGLLFAIIDRLIRHHNAVEVCNLCGSPSSCKHMHDIHGTKVCAGDLWNQENRITQELQTEPEQQRDVSGGEYDLQRASTLPSGKQFSPVPWALRPPRLTAFDRLCNSAAGGVRCSGSRRHIPRVSRCQRTFNSFEATLFFMTPIDEDEYISAVRTKKRGEIWEGMPDGVKPEVRRHLWSHIPTNTTTKSPFKRFL